MGFREVEGFGIPIIKMGEAVDKVSAKPQGERGVQLGLEFESRAVAPSSHPFWLCFYLPDAGALGEGRALPKLGDSRRVCSAAIHYPQVTPNS